MEGTATPGTIEALAQASPSEFREQFEQVWHNVETIKETIVDQVESGGLAPITALGMLSCVTGQALGYQAFHGQPTVADLYASVADGGRLSLANPRQPVGAR